MTGVLTLPPQLSCWMPVVEGDTKERRHREGGREAGREEGTEGGGEGQSETVKCCKPFGRQNNLPNYT